MCADFIGVPKGGAWKAEDEPITTMSYTLLFSFCWARCVNKAQIQCFHAVFCLALHSSINMEQIDKERFIGLCKAGDEYALGLLYTTYAPQMKRLCLRYVGDEMIAEDILHDGFIIIMSSIHQLKDASKIESWMAAIMRNLAIKYLDRSSKALLVPIDEIEESEAFAADTTAVISDYKELLRLIDTLPLGYKSVFKLSVFEGMPHKEIGELLGINAHSSSSQLARAREVLRIMVAKYGFIPLVIIALLLALYLNKSETTETKFDTPRTALHKSTRQETVSQKQNIRERIEIKISANDTDTIYVARQTAPPLDTVNIKPTDTTEGKETPMPSHKDNGYLAVDNNYPTTQKKQEKSNWQASVSYSGGAEASNSLVTEKPGSIISGTEKETVETRTHRYMPFVISLSLQKSLAGRWGIGTGLRYTRLKSDITTIDSWANTTRTQTVEYIGIPLNTTYRLWNSGNFSVYTTTGIAADIPVSGSKTWQWSVSAGAGFGYQLTPSVSVFAEPAINYHLNSSHGTPTIWTDRPLDVTIPLGLRISW